MKLARPVAAFGALIGFFGLGLQYWLLYADMSAQGASVLEITWRYFVWFTLLTNAFVTLVMARAALKPESLTGLNAPRIELMAVTSILFVCIVYNVLLASRWNPQGWQKAADVIVHDIVPVTFLSRPRSRFSGCCVRTARSLGAMRRSRRSGRWRTRFMG